MYALLLDLAYVPLAILYLPVLLYQMIALKKNRRGWAERFGLVRRRYSNQPCIWIHAVSLGEVNATKSLVAEIEKRLPDCQIAISATTDTGYAAAVKHYKPKPVFRYPLDFSFIVRRVLNRLAPDAIILMELEIWPNLVELARRREIPILIANGRITEERSMRRFRLPVVRGLARRMFSGVAFAGVQNETYAARFEELGVPKDRVVVTGTMKYDTAVIADAIPGDAALAGAMGIDRRRPLIVAGSTGPGEEEMLLDVFRLLRDDLPDVQLAIIPRKPERFDEVSRLIEAKGFACRRRSRHPDGGNTLSQAPCGAAVPAAKNDCCGAAVSAAKNTGETPVPQSGRVKAEPIVFLGDTMGELRKFYALADAVFVGRSLVPMGGSDLMEVAALGRAMCFGPYVDNFADVAEQLIAARAAVSLNAAAALVPTFRRLLTDADAARAMGQAAQEVVRRNTGATARTVDLLCKCLGRGMAQPGPAPIQRRAGSAERREFSPGRAPT